MPTKTAQTALGHLVPLTRTMILSRRFPRAATVLARHFPDKLSLLGGVLFLAIAGAGSIRGLFQ